MKLRVKRAHHMYPGIFLRVGDEIMLEPDQLCEALTRRGFFEEAPAPSPAPKKARRSKDEAGTDQS